MSYLKIFSHPILLVLLTLVVPLAIPRQSTYLAVAGQDSFATHWPLHAGHTVGQTLVSPYHTLTGVDLIIVPYRGAPAGNIMLTLKSAGGKELARRTVAAATAADDQALSFPLPIIRGLKDQVLLLELTSDHAEPHVAVRFDPNQQAIESGTGLRDGHTAPGDLALSMQRQTSIYGQLIDTMQARPDLYIYIVAAALAGAIIALAAWWASSYRRLLIAVVIIVSMMLPWRLLLVGEVRGESGGDAYNFLLIMQRISEHGQLYHPTEKRLPAWPLTLLPSTLVTTDTLAAGRVINQFIVAATVVLLAVLGWQLKLSPPAIMFAVLVTAFNRDFLLTSFRPLAYPLTGLLVLGGLNCMLWARTQPRRLILAGLVLGAAGQTRQEALLAGAAVIAVAVLLWAKEKKWRPVAAVLVPWLCMIAPYFVANAIFFGNPLYSGYLDHPVTNPRLSAGEVREHFEQGWAVISSTWWPAWRQQMRIEPSPFAVVSFWAAIMFGVVVPAVRRQIPRLQVAVGYLATPVAIVVALLTAQHFIATPLATQTKITIALVILAALGSLVLLARAITQPRPVALTIATALSLYGVATWVHPVEKTYFSFLPYLGLLAGLGLQGVIDGLWGDGARAGKLFLPRLAGSAVLLAIVALPLVQAVLTLPAAIDYANRKNIVDYLMYEASRALAQNTGAVAMHHEALSAVYFLPNRVIRFPETTTDPTPAELKAQNVRWLVWLSNDSLFNSYAANTDRYPVYFSSRGETVDDELLTVRVLELRE